MSNLAKNTSAYLFCLAVAGIGILCASTASAQVSVIGGRGVVLSELAGTDTYVTVVLKGSFARDRNLRIIEVGDSYFAVRLPNGERHVYRFIDVRELRIQRGRIGTHNSESSSRFTILNEDEQSVADRALAKAEELTNQRQLNITIRIQAVTVLAAAGNLDALRSLQELTNSDDLGTALKAATYLHIVGEPPSAELLRQGLASGNRVTRASAARLVGLSESEIYREAIHDMLEDPIPEIFPSAARATGRLGNNGARTKLLIDALSARNEEKADAAIFALAALGGEDIHQTLLKKLDTSKGIIWFRIVQVLYALEDETAQKLMVNECMRSPAFAPEASIILARNGDWSASLYLRDQLEKRRDPNRENLAYMARVAATLVSIGDLQANKTLRYLLNMTEKDIFARGKYSDPTYKIDTLKDTQVLVCNLMSDIGDESLLPLANTAIDSPFPEVAIAACETAIAIANPEYRKRLMESRI
ncbi:MAG: HEAT repeat domain-containing protein [Candidatus Hydrogenedentes bacterium]|nr:HEAT repeat domain-containing protein [Candidatus Hydrogenedentota bacterium]